MRETIKNLKKVYKYGKKYKKCLIIQILCCLIGIIINIIVPLVSAKFIVNFTNSVWYQALFMSLILLGINVINEIKVLIIRQNTQIFRRGTVRNIQLDLGKETLKLEQSILDSNSSGMFIQRIDGDTDKMAGIFTTGMGKLTGFISNVGSFIAILIIDYHMFIYYFIAAVILTILHYIKNEKVAQKELEYRNKSDQVAGITGELVRGARDIKMLYAKTSFLSILDENIKEQNEKNFNMRNADMQFNLLIDLLKNFFEFMTIVILVFLASKNIISVSIAVALYSYRSIVLTDLMEKVSSLFEECKNFNISCNRVFDIINSEKFQKEKFGSKHINNIKGNFEFKDVTFSYDGTNKILNKLNLKITENKTYGIVGKSGEGKTTIFNLLCKLYEISDGQILLDGVNLNGLDEESIRGNITIISQNPYIFNLSIKDNLKLVKNDITDEEIKQVCHLACLDNFINNLPNGYDTIVGEGGVNLSGGQRQRLAIARALVQKTKIILFDEATSALDNETQSEIQKAIDNLKAQYTIVIIAHRLSTIINCDTIMLLKDGKIAGKGTHNELLKSSAEYKKLCKTELVEE